MYSFFTGRQIMNRSGFVYDDRYLLHETGEHHPENPNRLRAILHSLSQSGLLDQLIRIQPEPSRQRWIEAVHHIRYILRFEETCAFGLPDMDHTENIVCRDSYEVAQWAVGGVLKAVDAVMEGSVDNAFCAIRPPGHHAEADKAMGFCYFNNVAVAARYLQKKWKLERVAIIDFDVHHGNGTQHIFEQDPTVFYYSIHEHPSFSYPGSGRDFDKGSGPGDGYTKNTPVLPGRGDAEYRRLLMQDLAPAMKKFQPEFLLVSAGFDAHTSDLMSSINLSDEGYNFISELLMVMAKKLCQGRMVSVLEGGYDLETLARLVTQHIRYLAGLE